MSTINFDPTNFAAMRRLMKEYGDSKTAFSGMNEEGEEVMISIVPDNITTHTAQRNGRGRVNVYYADGTTEEFFE